jgi:ankyrin repeat protein
MKILLKYETILNEKTNEGWSPIHVASRDGCDECIKILLEHGADVNEKGSGKWTPHATLPTLTLS